LKLDAPAQMRTPGVIRLPALASLAVCAWLGAAHGQSNDKGVEYLSHASSAFESGDYSEAATYIEEAMKTGLPKDLSARATFMRAQINERNGLLARALQDYSSALWMETLSPGERKKAQEGKARVIAAMGLTAPAPAKQTVAAGGGSGVPAGNGASNAAQPAPAQSSSSGGIFSMFSGLFGSAPAPAPQAQPAPQQNWKTATASPPAVEPKVDATEPVRAPAPKRIAKSPPAAPAPVKTASLQPASLPVSTGGGYMIFFESAASDASGRTKAKQIKKRVSDILVSRELDVTAGADGSYQITAGPYKAKSAALALCGAIKQRGVSCQVTP
jgi:hypothetical protein